MAAPRLPRYAILRVMNGFQDIHSHIVPGIDDGSGSFQETHDMLLAAREAGITEIFATSHLGKLEDITPDYVERYRVAFNRSAGMAREAGIRLRHGFEVHWRDIYHADPQKLRQFHLGGTDDLLLEFSDSELPQGWESFLYRLRGAGLGIIIAHPERYRAVQDDLDVVEDMMRVGCRIQVSATCLVEGMSSKRRKTARKLLAEGMVDFLASDAHSARDYRDFAKAMRSKDAAGAELGRL